MIDRAEDELTWFYGEAKGDLGVRAQSYEPAIGSKSLDAPEISKRALGAAGKYRRVREALDKLASDTESTLRRRYTEPTPQLRRILLAVEPPPAERPGALPRERVSVLADFGDLAFAYASIEELTAILGLPSGKRSVHVSKIKAQLVPALRLAHDAYKAARRTLQAAVAASPARGASDRFAGKDELS